MKPDTVTKIKISNHTIQKDLVLTHLIMLWTHGFVFFFVVRVLGGFTNTMVPARIREKPSATCSATLLFLSTRCCVSKRPWRFTRRQFNHPTPFTTITTTKLQFASVFTPRVNPYYPQATIPARPATHPPHKISTKIPPHLQRNYSPRLYPPLTSAAVSACRNSHPPIVHHPGVLLPRSFSQPLFSRTDNVPGK